MAIWNDIANSRIDADSPLDETLFLYFRDNQIWLKDQLGGKMFGDGADGAGSYTSGTTTSTDRIKRFTSLSISAGATLQFNSGFAIIAIQGDLTLNGTLKVEWNGSGGDGDRTDGWPGSYLVGMEDWISPCGKKTSTLAVIAPGNGGTGMWGNGGNYSDANREGVNRFRHWDSGDLALPIGTPNNPLAIADSVASLYFPFNSFYWLHGRATGGGGGAHDTTGGGGGDGGDAGGTLILLVGGQIAGTGTIEVNGANGVNSGSGTAGGGGGGGGAYIIVDGDVSAIAVDASGGDDGVVGSGGGGGRIDLLYSGSLDGSYSSDVTGGSGSVANGENGQATTNNVSDVFAYWY